MNGFRKSNGRSEMMDKAETAWLVEGLAHHARGHGRTGRAVAADHARGRYRRGAHQATGDREGCADGRRAILRQLLVIAARRVS